MGFRCNFAASVWMGYPGFDGQPVLPMNSVHGEAQQGGRLPARMWHDFMTRVDPILNDNCDLADLTEFPEGKDFDDEDLPGNAVAGGPVAANPAIDTPVTVTAPPMTSPPVTDPPVTEPPVTLPPTTLPGQPLAGQTSAGESERRRRGST